MARNLNTEKEVEIPASTQVANITELLEEILLHTDNRTLLLSQRTSKKFQDIIQTNKKIQKKLFFTQPTFDEALELDIVTEDTLVHSRSPQLVMVLNPLTLTMNADDDIVCRTGRLCKNIIQDTTHPSRRGKSSWERMYSKTLSSPKSKVSEISVWWPTFWEERPILRDGQTMREGLDKAAQWNREELGLFLPWKIAKIEVSGWEMEYRIWKRESQKARDKGVDNWWETDVREMLMAKSHGIE